MGKRRGKTSQTMTNLLPQSKDDNVTNITKLRLTAANSFFERSSLAECPAMPENAQEDVTGDATTFLFLVNHLPHSFASNRISGILPHRMEVHNLVDQAGKSLNYFDQDGSTDLEALIAWFREGSDRDQKAILAFPATLSKSHRARVHTLVQSIGLGSLVSMSAGVGEDRFISILRSGEVVQNCTAQLSPALQDKAFWIYRWARGAGKTVSRDEIAEMLLCNSLTEELERLWSEGSAQQKLIIKLCETITEGDCAGLKGILQSDDGVNVVRFGKYDLISGRGVLHCAAREGQLEALEILLNAGAAIDALDGHGLTALQVSRRHPEQCEAESILLRAGALDTRPNEASFLTDPESEDDGHDLSWISDDHPESCTTEKKP